MLKIVKRFANRREIAELQLELNSLKARLSSMEDKAFRSRSLAEYWQEQVKVGLAPESEKEASVAYYWEENEKDEAELAQMRSRMLEIKERLLLLGF